MMEKSMIPSERYFRLIWKREFHYLKTVRHNRLGVCDQCVRFENQIAQAGSQEHIKQFQKLKAAHIEQVRKGTY